MPLDPVEDLVAGLVAGGKWPPKRDAHALRLVERYRAFLESDRDALRALADWPAGRPYKVDPLPALMADAWADHLFGEPPVLEPGSETDDDAFASMLEGNPELVSDWHAAERIVAGEGEAWWRVYVDRDVADVPLLEWHSRDVVYPLFVGRRLLAAALVTEHDEDTHGQSGRVFRHLEVHADELVVHRLFAGTAGQIGDEVPLTALEATAELGEALGDTQAWAHGLPMLMGRIVNRRGRRFELGESDYARIADYLLDLNEAATIGAENMRLTAKKRAVVPESALRPRAGAPVGDTVDRGDGVRIPATGGATFNAGEDVLVVSELDAELGGTRAQPFTVLEYSFDAAALIAYKRDLVESALTRVGLTPQYVGVVSGDGDGLALSGTALRLRLIPTTKAGAGKARPWDTSLPRILSLMARVYALPEDDGGFGVPMAEPEALPAVERPNALPADEVEDAQIEAALVGAGVRSVRTSIERQHPDWTPQQIDDELERIREDRASSAPSPLGGFTGGV